MTDATPRFRWVLVEHHGSASERTVDDDVGVLELTNDEVIEMNRKMVRSACRLLPALWFKL